MGQRELDLVKNYTGHDFDAVLNMYYAKARMYDAENRRFVSIDPILDETKYDLSEYTTEAINFSAYIYVQNNPLIYVDPLGKFLTGTVLKQNAKDYNVVEAKKYLYENGYLLYHEVLEVSDTYNYSTYNAVKEFQQKNGLAVTGEIDEATWLKMGFEVNQTLEEEFWSGQRGSDKLNICISGNDITINYSPTIRIFEEKPNSFFPLLTCKQDVDIDTYSIYEQRIVAGLKVWEKSDVVIQGVTANIKVNVSPTRSISNNANIKFERLWMATWGSLRVFGSNWR